MGLWFPRPGRVELRREALPEVGPGEAMIRAIASAISQGTEMLVYRGQVPPDLALDLPTFRGSFAFPIKYGYACVGRVEDVGVGVGGLARGDLVFTYHPHQDLFVLPSSLVVPLPRALTPEAGVFVANLETAVNVMLDAGPRLGERVAIFGQGVVGLLLTWLVRRSGAGLVVAVDPIEGRRMAARIMGADVVLEPHPGVSEEVRRLCGAIGADLALEASGRGEALDQAIGSVAFQGTVVVCSWYGTKPVGLSLGGAFHRGRVRIVSSQVSSIDPALQPRWTRRRRLELVLTLLEGLDPRTLITHRIPFARAAEAYDLVDRRPEETIQVVLTYE